MDRKCLCVDTLAKSAILTYFLLPVVPEGSWLSVLLSVASIVLWVVTIVLFVVFARKRGTGFFLGFLHDTRGGA